MKSEAIVGYLFFLLLGTEMIYELNASVGDIIWMGAIQLFTSLYIYISGDCCLVYNGRE